MSRLRRNQTVLVAAMLSLVAAAPVAQQAVDPCAGTRSNPADASLELSFKDGQTTFHQGELLSLALGFASKAPQKYYLDTRSYDRSGRMTSERFCLEPDAGRDPLASYFGSGIFGGFMGGGLGGIATLGLGPSNAEIDLNEWRVLPPGRYRLRLESHRVSRSATRDEPGSGRVSVPLWSNVVEFRVLPATPEWEAAQLGAAMTALDSTSNETARRGARILRFLESENATRELARRFEARTDQTGLSDRRFGLIGSPHRQLAIDGLRAALVDPWRPVTQELLMLLALLEVEMKPESRMPPYTEANRDTWLNLAERKREAYKGAIAQHLQEAMAVLDKKTDAARAVTINALLTAPPPAAIDRASLRKMLVASWDSLPVRTRNELLQSRWDDIGGPDFLPILRQIVSAPPPVGRQVTQQVERGPALARLYVLSPAEGRELILREMVAPRRTVTSMGVLGLLPDRELPEIEDRIFARFRAGEGSALDFELLERYGTARSFPEVQRAYARARGRWACALQNSALRQFIKADPAFGAAEVEFALAQRKETGCYQSLLGDLKDKLAVPEVERIAIAALDDPSPQVVRFAAEALGANGSPAAESALWRRLETFHQAFKDRPDELRTGPGFDDARAGNNMVEYALMNAIAKGQAWLSGTDKLVRLKGLVSPLRQNEVASLEATRQRAELDMRLSWPSYSTRIFYDVAGYSGNGLERLVQKLKQFPPGTQIVYPLTLALVDRHRADVEAVQQAARVAGVVLRIKYP